MGWIDTWGMKRVLIPHRPQTWAEWCVAQIDALFWTYLAVLEVKHGGSWPYKLSFAFRQGELKKESALVRALPTEAPGSPRDKDCNELLQICKKIIYLLFCSSDTFDFLNIFFLICESL